MHVTALLTCWSLLALVHVSLNIAPGFFDASRCSASTHSVRGFGATFAGEGESGLASAARTCSVNSFTAGTLVLLADGRQIPISKVKPGMKVVATDPATATTAARKVDAVIVHGGKHTMVDRPSPTAARSPPPTVTPSGTPAPASSPTPSTSRPVSRSAKPLAATLVRAPKACPAD